MLAGAPMSFEFNALAIAYSTPFSRLPGGALKQASAYLTPLGFGAVALNYGDSVRIVLALIDKRPYRGCTGEECIRLYAPASCRASDNTRIAVMPEYIGDDLPAHTDLLHSLRCWSLLKPRAVQFCPRVWRSPCGCRWTTDRF